MEEDTIIMTDEERKKSLEEAKKALEQAEAEAKDEADGSGADKD
jgi:hypothetical protein